MRLSFYTAVIAGIMAGSTVAIELGKERSKETGLTQLSAFDGSTLLQVEKEV